MGVNLESGNLRRLYQRQPVSGWSRLPDDARQDYPLRIYTLGRFGIQLHDLTVSPPHSRQHRPLQMLQALIALGGRDVSAEMLGQALWPDADGDMAKNTFDVTLHRLRRLLGVQDLLQLRDQHLTLNSQLAWVDAWTFERLANHAERLLPHAENTLVQRQLTRVGDRLMTLYQGNFLEREISSAWSLTLRERLRSKLLRHLLDNGRIQERRAGWEAAIRLYQKGLEIDPLTEALYQRLIICYRETGRRAEALATYERCRSLLARQFQIEPSATTLSLYAALQA